MLYFVSSHIFNSLNSKTNVVTNFNLFISAHKSFSLFLIEDSVSLSCSSGLYHSLLFIKKSIFIILLYKELVKFLPAPHIWEIFLVCFIVIDNLQEVCGYSIITDFISTMLGFSISLGSLVIIFDRLTIFCFSSLNMIYSILFDASLFIE